MLFLGATQGNLFGTNAVVMGTVSHTVRTPRYPRPAEAEQGYQAPHGGTPPRNHRTVPNRLPYVAPNKNSEARPKPGPDFIFP